MRPLGAGLGNKKNIKKISMVSNCTRCQIVRFYTWCQIVRGVKLSWCQIVRCQIVLVSNCPVSNCPRCQIVRCQIVLVSNCPPTWAVSNCPRCQIVLVSNCPGTIKNKFQLSSNITKGDPQSAAVGFIKRLQIALVDRSMLMH